MRWPRARGGISVWCSARTRRSRSSPGECRRLSSPTAAGAFSTRRRSSRCGLQAVANHRLARVLFQTALDLAEERQGGLLVVVADPARAIGRLIAPHDVLEAEPASLDHDEPIDRGVAGPAVLAVWPDLPARSGPGRACGFARSRCCDELPGRARSKRSIHYLARGASVTELDTAVLEALAGLDGAW